jgi:ribokinase
MGKIVVVGSLNMDMVVRTAGHPKPGETVLGGEFQTFPGGKGANQAVAAARLGADVQMIGKVGKDAFGKQLLDGLVQDGVDIRYIDQDEAQPTGIAMITLDQSGQNTIVVASGANMCLTPEEVEKAETAFQDANLLMVQLETPLSAIEKAVQLARKHHMKVVLNPAPARPLPRNLLQQIDYLLPNESELTILAPGHESMGEAVAELHRKGTVHVIVTLGKDGVLVSTEGDTWTLPAHKVTVKDTVAAGDAFAGGFCTALSENKSLEEAIAWGNAAGALAVTRLGAQTSLPTRQELMQFLKEQR